MLGGGDNGNDIHYISTDGQRNTIYTSDRSTNNDSDMKMYNIELNYVHKFSDRSNIDITLSNNQWKNDGLSVYQERYIYTDGRPDSTSYQTQDNNMNDKSWEVQVDYTNTLSEFAKIEAGYKGVFQRNGSPVDTYEGATAETITQNRKLYNNFKYNQDVHALYFTYGGKWGNLSYQAGLRGEYWTVETLSKNYDQEFNGAPAEAFSTDFFKLFRFVPEIIEVFVISLKHHRVCRS